MQVGDLVKHSGMDDVFFGIITKEKSVLKTKQQGNPTFVMKYCVEFTYGDWGWFFAQDLESVCK